ncbi:MAG: hypothetical protein RIC53_16615 [Cyclobacteriaceae bacterium]
MKRKGLAPGVGTEGIGKDDVSSVFTNNKHLVLIIDEFIRNATNVFKSFFMGLKWPIPK